MMSASDYPHDEVVEEIRSTLNISVPPPPRQQQQQQQTKETAYAPLLMLDKENTQNFGTGSTTQQQPQASMYHGPLSTRHGRHGTTSSKAEKLVDKMVQVANACNQLMRKNYCNMCHVYADRQVEFEQRQQEIDHCQNGDSPDRRSTASTGSSPTERVWQNMNAAASTMEVDLYRQFLFDEESVCAGIDLLDSKVESTVAPSSSMMKPATTAAPNDNLQDEPESRALQEDETVPEKEEPLEEFQSEM